MAELEALDKPESRIQRTAEILPKNERTEHILAERAQIE
mgnify:CR=1 FL=1